MYVFDDMYNNTCIRSLSQIINCMYMADQFQNFSSYSIPNIYIHTHIVSMYLCAMWKLLSKFRKSENKADISFYKIWVDTFNNIDIASPSVSKRFQTQLQMFCMVTLLQLVNLTIIFAFSLFLALQVVLFVSRSFPTQTHTCHIIIRRVAVRAVI